MNPHEELDDALILIQATIEEHVQIALGNLDLLTEYYHLRDDVEALLWELGMTWEQAVGP